MGFPDNRVRGQSNTWNFQISKDNLRNHSLTNLGSRKKKLAQSPNKRDILMWLFFCYIILDLIIGQYLSRYSDQWLAILSFELIISSFNKNFQFQPIKSQNNFSYRLVFFIISFGVCLLKSFLLQVSQKNKKINQIYKQNTSNESKCLRQIKQKCSCQFQVTRFGKRISSLQIIFRFINFPTLLMYSHCHIQRNLSIGNFRIPKEMDYFLTLVEQFILVFCVSALVFIVNELCSQLGLHIVLSFLAFVQSLLKFYFLYQTFKSNLVSAYWMKWLSYKRKQIKKKIRGIRFLNLKKKKGQRKREMTYQEIVQTYRIRK